VVVLAYGLFSPSEASAGGFVLVTWGETIDNIGDVSWEHRQGPGPKKVGYESSYFGLFWIDLWTWGGEYCVYEGDRYSIIEASTAARLIGRPERDLSPPFLYRWPLGWFFLGAFILIGIIAAVFDKRNTNAIAMLFQDARYQRALEIIHERCTKPPAEGPATQDGEPQGEPEDEDRFRPAFEAAVRHLVEAGIAHDDAARNLMLMVQALAQARAHERGGSTGE
jgi:hypothetical protein